MKNTFYALISRMRNISRWSLMRNTYNENVQEHSHMVAVIAHALAVIRRDVYGIPCDPGEIAAAALLHDASEIFTGDMPTPVKYLNADIMNAYKTVEEKASEKLLGSLPEELRGAYVPLLTPKDAEAKKLIKAADTISAYIKCIEELKTGNNEFRSASIQTLAKLQAMNMPEVNYFLEKFISSFELTLDELSLEQH